MFFPNTSSQPSLEQLDDERRSKNQCFMRIVILDSEKLNNLADDVYLSIKSEYFREFNSLIEDLIRLKYTRNTEFQAAIDQIVEEAIAMTYDIVHEKNSFRRNKNTKAKIEALSKTVTLTANFIASLQNGMATESEALLKDLTLANIKLCETFENTPLRIQALRIAIVVIGLIAAASVMLVPLFLIPASLSFLAGASLCIASTLFNGAVYVGSLASMMHSLTPQKTEQQEYAEAIQNQAGKFWTVPISQEKNSFELQPMRSSYQA